ncbi:hypothetical protein GDN83_05870 [Gordonia jinghuaiqii]|uniref:Lipoprotein n=1 Tax=Gordonia jinghuaiqii TaxID=2758710 RepID=A0A7D7LVU3_9ACTN|nr:hypothetical protein [Gordonia jinghuaiqii]MCR5977275.1 hypothetical protein [Gordonia jinghuaiqii]QMT00136.1 hypothetical protein H1R19_14465 [Gordonia jinghuaiqii]
MSPRARVIRSLVSSFAVAAAVSALVAGCSSESDDAGAPNTASAGGCAAESPSRAAGATPVPIAPATVTVLGAGDGERRVATAAPDVASAQSVTLVTTSQVASPGSSDAQTVETPLTARFGCTEKSDLELDLGTVTSPDTGLTEQLAAMGGTKAGITLGPGLAPVSLRLAPAADAGEEARLALEQSLVAALNTAIVLPTEPIAVGASWRSERVIAAAATVTQSIEARLTAWEGDRLTIEFTAEESPVNSVFAIPGSADTLTISRYSNTGEGRVTVDLRRGLPVAGEATYRGARELVGADPARPLLQRTGLSVTWR